MLKFQKAALLRRNLLRHDYVADSTTLLDYLPKRLRMHPPGEESVAEDERLRPSIREKPPLGRIRRMWWVRIPAELPHNLTEAYCGEGRRKLRIWSREGTLQYTGEDINGLEQAFSWKPSGSLSASSQRLPNKHKIIFFEKNGMNHGGFQLPFAPREFEHASTAWAVCESSYYRYTWSHAVHAGPSVKPEAAAGVAVIDAGHFAQPRGETPDCKVEVDGPGPVNGFRTSPIPSCYRPYRDLNVANTMNASAYCSRSEKPFRFEHSKNDHICDTLRNVLEWLDHDSRWLNVGWPCEIKSNQGGTCESRCWESGVSTDPEPCGFARPRLAMRGFPVSGEKGILVVEPSPG
ncbi:putative elongator complex protein 1 [Ixodes scapularis]